MLAVVAIGLLTVGLSVLMIASPAAMARGILAFEQKPYFHAAEVSSRLLLGSLLLVFASQTLHPRVIAGFGCVLLAAALGLLVLGARRHRAFAVRSATFTSVFRTAGFASLAFGVFVIYSAGAALVGQG
jgi:protein-S-isoprenylcysteine O-methyltransferase Ste14